MSETSLFVRPLLEFLFPNSAPETLVTYHAYIRKLAHLTEYAILGLIASRAFFHSSKYYLSGWWFCTALAVVFVISATDELNQTFTPGRTGSIGDVGLDLIGGVLGTAGYGAFAFLKNRRIRKT
jgi:VanZ family protein